MRDALGPDTVLGYCMNVHPAASFDDLCANLDQHAAAVKQRLAPEAPMGVGLWLPASAARQVEQRALAPTLRDTLDHHGLLPFTINGFPYGDFHADPVKHAVYRPTWAEPSRREYTMTLARLLAAMLPEGGEGSISTVPIGWPTDLPDEAALTEAAANLRQLARSLADLEQRTGRWIHVDLEPEPGCLLDRSVDLVTFFERWLFGRGEDERVRRYLGVCHDVCHAAVLFEPQAEAIRRYCDAGISIGKVQLSSAVEAPFDAMDPADRPAAIEQLRRFDEPRYLHQTMLGDAGPLVEDLSEALAGIGRAEATRIDQPWRVHFHVPLFVDRFGGLGATQSDVREALALLAGSGAARHFEVETYAWGVLPRGLQATPLAAGIAEELAWARQQCNAPAGEG